MRIQSTCYSCSWDIFVFRLALQDNRLLNWKVFKTANRLQVNTVAAVQARHLAGSNLSQQEQFETRRIMDRKAAVDVCIIVVAFLLCYLPDWIVFNFYQFFGKEFPLRAIQFTRCILYASTLNLIFYSIRKRELRAWVKKMLRRMPDLCGIPSVMNNVTNDREWFNTPSELALDTPWRTPPNIRVESKISLGEVRGRSKDMIFAVLAVTLRKTINISK